MKKYILAAFLIFSCNASVTPASAADVVQDSQIAIYPAVRQFPVTALGNDSTPVDFTITNLTGTAMNVSGIALAGINPAEFDLHPHSCTGTLAAHASCTVSVSFKPASQGTKSALLQVSSSSTNTPVLTAWLTNSAAPLAEAQQRMPAVLAAATVPVMTRNNQATISWTLEGYDASYLSEVAIFDCSGKAAGSCGNSYGEKLATSGSLLPLSSVAGDWAFNGSRTKKFYFSWDYTPNSAVAELVVRFYIKTDVDAARGSSGVSLLIPGNPGLTYYDQEGRRLKTVINN